MTKKAIDIDDVLERVQDDQELLVELLDIFQEDYGQKRVSLGDYVEAGDYEQIKNTIHSLKGAAGNISAVDVHATCAHIEHLAEKQDVESIKSQIGILDQQYAVLQECIKEVKKSFSRS